MPDDARTARRRAMLASLLVSGVMLVGKWMAYLLTGSAALLADAAETVVHAAATGFAAFSLWYAARPADANHPYGHGRIAYMSVAFEGMLVFAAAVAVISSGVWGLVKGVQLHSLELGLAISLSMAVINLVLGLWLVQTGRRSNAVILVANGRHVLADVWTTAAALAGLGAVWLTGVEWLDPLAALVIGFWILLTAVQLIRKAVAGIMDEVDAELVERIAQTLDLAVREGHIVAYHQLRCRALDDALWIDVHFLLPGDLSVTAAHDRATTVEKQLKQCFAGRPVIVTSHLEPEDHDRAHPVGHEQPDSPWVS